MTPRQRALAAAAVLGLNALALASPFGGLRASSFYGCPASLSSEECRWFKRGQDDAHRRQQWGRPAPRRPIIRYYSQPQRMPRPTYIHLRP